MDIKKEYLDLNDNFSYHKASAADWRGIGYMEIPSGADIYFMEWFYKEIQEGKWLVWDKHQDSWKPCDYDFREDCPNIHWKREGVTLKKALDKSISNKTVPEGFVLVSKDQFDSLCMFKDLYKRAIINAKKRKDQLNWAHVAGLGVGSGRAVELCKMLNIDPSATNMHEVIQAQEQSHD